MEDFLWKEVRLEAQASDERVRLIDPDRGAADLLVKEILLVAAARKAQAGLLVSGVLLAAAIAKIAADLLASVAHLELVAPRDQADLLANAVHLGVFKVLTDPLDKETLLVAATAKVADRHLDLIIAGVGSVLDLAAKDRAKRLIFPDLFKKQRIISLLSKLKSQIHLLTSIFVKS